MTQIDTTFLADLGLTNLPDDKQQGLLQQLQAELEARVGEKLTAGMNDEQLAEFDDLLAGNEEKVRQWLQMHVPDYEQAEDYKALLEEASISEGQPTSTDMLSGYAVTKWLEANSPGYQKVVEETLEELKEEVIHNRDVIMNKDGE